MAQKLTKLEAAARLEVSQSTIDRMIQRGDLQVQKERHGNRHRIWVVLDESREAATGVFDPTFPIWLKSFLSNSSMVFQPSSNYRSFGVVPAIITP